MKISYPGTPGTPFFDGQIITDFLYRYSQLCIDYNLSSESEKFIDFLVIVVSFLQEGTMKIVLKGADWSTVRSILPKEYQEQ